MKSAFKIKIDEEIIWRGDWGSDAPIKAIIKTIDACKDGSKNGRSVKTATVNEVDGRVVVGLDNGHWAYGYQISKLNK